MMKQMYGNVKTIIAWLLLACKIINYTYNTPLKNYQPTSYIFGEIVDRIVIYFLSGIRYLRYHCLCYGILKYILCGIV